MEGPQSSPPVVLDEAQVAAVRSGFFSGIGHQPPQMAQRGFQYIKTAQFYIVFLLINILMHFSLCFLSHQE